MIISEDPASTLNNYILKIIENKVASKIMSRVKVIAWFNADCKTVYNEKQGAFQLWPRIIPSLIRIIIPLLEQLPEGFDTAVVDYNAHLHEVLAGANHCN